MASASSVASWNPFSFRRKRARTSDSSILDDEGDGTSSVDASIVDLMDEDEEARSFLSTTDSAAGVANGRQAGAHRRRTDTTLSEADLLPFAQHLSNSHDARAAIVRSVLSVSTATRVKDVAVGAAKGGVQAASLVLSIDWVNGLVAGIDTAVSAAMDASKDAVASTQASLGARASLKTHTRDAVALLRGVGAQLTLQASRLLARSGGCMSLYVNLAVPCLRLARLITLANSRISGNIKPQALSDGLLNCMASVQAALAAWNALVLLGEHEGSEGAAQAAYCRSATQAAEDADAYDARRNPAASALTAVKRGLMATLRRRPAGADSGGGVDDLGAMSMDSFLSGRSSALTNWAVEAQEAAAAEAGGDYFVGRPRRSGTRNGSLDSGRYYGEDDTFRDWREEDGDEDERQERLTDLMSLGDVDDYDNDEDGSVMA